MSYCNLYGPPPIISEDNFRFQILDRAFAEFEENANKLRQNLSTTSEEMEQTSQRIDALHTGYEEINQNIDALSTGYEEINQNIDALSTRQDKTRRMMEKLNQQMDRRAENNKKCKIDLQISEIKEAIVWKSIAIGALALVILTGIVAAVFSNYLLSIPCLVAGTVGVIKCSLSIAENLKEIKGIKA